MDSSSPLRVTRCVCYPLRVQFPKPALNWREHIETKPEVLAGRPVATGTRIPVGLVVELLAQEWTTEEIVGQYPALSREDIQACLHYASERLKPSGSALRKGGLSGDM
jgi:uncharacterized protein (DUF433 family)